MMNTSGHLRFMWLLPLAAAGMAFAQNLPDATQHIPLPHPELPEPVNPSLFSWSWLLILFSALAAVLFVIVIWLLSRKQQPRQTAANLPPLALAHSRLLELLENLEKFNPAEIGHRVSVIIRDYQMSRYAVPALFRTREELYDLQGFATDEERRSRFASIALTCDQIAFAPAPASRAEAQSLVQSAIETLRREAPLFENISPN